MKTYLKEHITLFALFILTFSVNAQKITWNSAPKKGFVFEISNKEAQKLLTCKYPDSLFKKMLHTLKDTFDTEKGWIKRPEKGHFILARIAENKLHCDYTCVYPYQVLLLKEYDGLAIQVLDTDGNVREDAKVKFRYRRLSFDPETKMYREENDWFRSRHKIVTVELDGFRSVFDITKNDVPSWYNNYDNYSSPGIYSYMISDKNKYKPGDKVRFKSYALTGNRIPFRNTLEIRLTDYRKNWKMGTVDPHRPGSFAGEFMLHDSLKLTLDKTYYIQLLEKNGRVVSSCSFMYEDYELTGNMLDLQLNDKQFYPESNRLIIKATDVNGLIMKDARAEILITTAAINETFQTAVVLHDTLFFKKMELDPDDPSVLQILPEWFQKSNTSYNVSVTVLNSQNHRMEVRKSANFIYSQYELKNRFSNDSICFDLYKNNQLLSGIPAKLWYNNNHEAQNIILPYKEKLNAATTLIKIENDFVTKQITMSHLVPELELVGGIKRDSFCIKLENPQKLDVSWFVYRGSILLDKGFGKEFQYDSIIEDRSQTYYVELLYSFGGQDHIIKKQYEFREDFLDVSLDLPDRVYPGQKTEATISVKNQIGEPVRNVDLTALAVTAKLNYELPDLPYYGPKSSSRPKKATYSKREVNSRSAILNLDYLKWEKMAGLDTMMYYRLTYPKNKFVYEIDIDDSTQFAPYIMQNGRAL